MAGGSGRVGNEPVSELAEGFAAVADRCFLSTIDLRQRAAIRGEEKDGVVAEAVRAARLRRDPPLDDAGRLEIDAAVVRDGHVRDESRGARGPLLPRELPIDRRELHPVI